jgi:hypothetical protein
MNDVQLELLAIRHCGGQNYIISMAENMGHLNAVL